MHLMIILDFKLIDAFCSWLPICPFSLLFLVTHTFSSNSLSIWSDEVQIPHALARVIDQQIKTSQKHSLGIFKPEEWCPFSSLVTKLQGSELRLLVVTAPDSQWTQHGRMEPTCRGWDERQPEWWLMMSVLVSAISKVSSVSCPSKMWRYMSYLFYLVFSLLQCNAQKWNTGSRGSSILELLLFSIVVVPSYIFTNSTQQFPFFTSS